MRKLKRGQILTASAVNERGNKLEIEFEEKDEAKEEQKAPRECQWITVAGSQCKREGKWQWQIIDEGKIKILPAIYIKSFRSCCTLCTQHLSVGLGLSVIGLAHLLFKYFLGDDEKLLYQGTLFVSFGHDFNAFKEIYRNMLLQPSVDVNKSNNI